MSSLTGRDDGRRGRRDGNVSRRRLLAAAGGLAGAGVAGCLGGGGGGPGSDGGDGDDGDGSDNASGGGQQNGAPIESAYDHYTWNIPTDTHFNPFAAKGWDGKVRNLLYDPLAVYNHKTQEYTGFVLSDWSIAEGGEKLTLSINDEFTWHNGEPVTAKDLVTQFRISKYLDDPLWNYLESVEAADEKTLEAAIPPANPDLVYAEVFSPGRFVYAPASRYKEWLTRLEEEDTDSVLSELFKYHPGEPIGNGPMQLAKRNKQRYVFEWYDDYPLAEAPNFDEFHLEVAQSNQQKWAGLKGDELDAAETFMPASVIDTLGEDVRMETLPYYGGSCLAFNHDKGHLGDPAVRKAIAYVLPRPSVSEAIYGPVATPVQHLTGLPDRVNKSFLSDSLDQFEQYDKSPEEATKRLREAGYSKESGTWTKDGQAVSFEIAVPAGTSNQVAGYKSAAEHLSGFGIEANIRTVEGTKFWGSLWPNSQFEAAQNYWSGRVPYNAEEKYFIGTMASPMNIPDPPEFEVPSEFGSPSSSTETVNLAKKLSKLQTATEEQQRKTLLKDITWAFNQTLPVLPVVQKKIQIFVTADNWDMPPKDAAPMNRGDYQMVEMLLRSGDLQAKTK